MAAPASTSTSAPLTLVVDGVHHLRGGRCTACATHAFPCPAACPKCGSEMDAAALPTGGAVWSWTVQRMAPKPPYRGPDPFEPFVVAYVDLGPVLVESPLRGRPVDGWTIGDAVQLDVDVVDGAATAFRFVPGEST